MEAGARESTTTAVTYFCWRLHDAVGLRPHTSSRRQPGRRLSPSIIDDRSFSVTVQSVSNDASETYCFYRHLSLSLSLSLCCSSDNTLEHQAHKRHLVEGEKVRTTPTFGVGNTVPSHPWLASLVAPAKLINIGPG